ncbi:MAG: polymer-forming cytoskeletal protein [Oscillospiraceae bacterium]|nr:polymer-forming cytoskeletal protein [Oscillospiraceae bacterium]
MFDIFKSIKKDNYETSEPVTLISKRMRIEANLLSGTGIVRIEGEYYGEVYVDGELILEKSGYINGNINVKIAYISGSIEGNVKCADLLHITSTGKITGDIECEAVLMDEGAVFIGYSKMTEKIDPDPLGLDE